MKWLPQACNVFSDPDRWYFNCIFNQLPINSVWMFQILVRISPNLPVGRKHRLEERPDNCQFLLSWSLWIDEVSEFSNFDKTFDSILELLVAILLLLLLLLLLPGNNICTYVIQDKNCSEFYEKLRYSECYEKKNTSNDYNFSICNGHIHHVASILFTIFKVMT